MASLTTTGTWSANRMSGHSAHAHAVLAALSTVASIATQRQGHDHAHAMTQLRHGALAHMVDAFVTQRVEVVKDGFVALLAQFAEQARHYMAQQKSYADRELDTDDPMRRIELRSRIQDIDTLLATLCADARLIYQQMTEIVRALGGSFQDIARDLSHPLALSSIA